jgi:hypothetical protein
MAKKVAKKVARKKAKAPSIPTLMERTFAAQQAVRARNDWRSQIRDTDARAKAFLTQHMQAQPNRYY